MTILRELEQTCWACPSQWEGKTDEGKYVYVRYRWGILSVGFGKDEWAAVDDSKSIGQYGDWLDGVMTTEEMLEHTGFEYDPIIQEA